MVTALGVDFRIHIMPFYPSAFLFFFSVLIFNTVDSVQIEISVVWLRELALGKRGRDDLENYQGSIIE